MKIIDGITFLKMIKDGEVKPNTEIKVWFNDDGLRDFVTTLYFNGMDLNWQPETFFARYFYNKHTEFEIVENKEYEDIDEIKICLDNDKYFINTINALIRNQKYILERLDK